MAAADAGEHGGDMPVTEVERRAELAVAPGDSGQASLEGGDRQVRAAALDLRREVETDRFRVGRQFGEPLAAQPGGEHFPVGGVGAPGVVGLGRAGVGLGGLGQGASRRSGAGRRQGVFAGRRGEGARRQPAPRELGKDCGPGGSCGGSGRLPTRRSSAGRGRGEGVRFPTPRRLEIALGGPGGLEGAPGPVLRRFARVRARFRIDVR